VSGLVTVSNSLMQINRKKIVNLAQKHQLPSMYESNHWVDAGGLMSYSADEAEQYRRAAVYVDKILKATAQPTMHARVAADKDNAERN
jgi:putative tryptophan/tyrosine transport system substrate-binding protein